MAKNRKFVKLKLNTLIAEGRACGLSLCFFNESSLCIGHWGRDWAAWATHAHSDIYVWSKEDEQQQLVLLAWQSLLLALSSNLLPPSHLRSKAFGQSLQKFIEKLVCTELSRGFLQPTARSTSMKSSQGMYIIIIDKSQSWCTQIFV